MAIQCTKSRAGNNNITIGYKLLMADGTSLNGRFRYPLDGTWVEVPGDGAYVADGFHDGLLSAEKPWDICVEVESEEPTPVVTVRHIRCYRRIRIRRILEEIMIVHADGTREYYRNGKRHRVGGPAIEYDDGTREWWVEGKLHREDGPAIEKPYSYHAWYRNGVLHRDDGPAIEYDDGTREWLRNGKLHREDGPALIAANGTRKWYSNGVLHRLDGPAIESPDGTRKWLRNGQLHREDGPAIERPDGSREWWRENTCYRVETVSARRSRPSQP